MTEHDYTYYQAPEGATYRIHLETDPDAESPRENDNLSTLITFGGRYDSPDGKVCDDRRHREVHSPFPSEWASRDGVDLRHLRKYAALFMPEILTVTGLRRDYDGTLSATDNEGGIEGVAFVTREDWDKLMGADYPTMGTDFPFEGGLVTPANAIEQEITAYNTWASGEYVGYVVEKREEWIHAADQLPVMHTWEHIDSCWGIDDVKYAMEAAVDTLPAGSVEINEDELEDDES